MQRGPELIRFAAELGGGEHFAWLCFALLCLALHGLGEARCKGAAHKWRALFQADGQELAARVSLRWDTLLGGLGGCSTGWDELRSWVDPRGARVPAALPASIPATPLSRVCMEQLHPHSTEAV